MGMLDLFTGANSKAAAKANAWGAQQGMAAAGGLFGNARDEITRNTNKANSFYEALTPLMEKGNAGYNAYGDAAGVNGAEGQARARALFTSNPGYQEGLNSGLDQLDRRAASRGMLNSGNTMQDTLKYATDYGNKAFGDYVNRLSPYLNSPNQQMALAGQRAGLYAGQGGALANLLAQQAGMTNQGYQNTGKAMGEYYNANDVAAKNMLGAGIQGLNLLGQGFGAMGGMSGLSSLFGGFGGGQASGIPTGMIY